MTRPAYNHTRGDSERTPCPDCATARLELVMVLTGTPDQIERWHAGVLPEDELLALAREKLFAEFAPYPRWNSRSNRRGASIQVTDVRHAADCGYRKGATEDFEVWRERLLDAGAVRFETTDASEVAKPEWDTFKGMTLLASRLNQQTSGATWGVQAQTHWATCTMCAEERLVNTALVTAWWAGRILSREYRLDNFAGKAKP